MVLLLLEDKTLLVDVLSKSLAQAYDHYPCGMPAPWCLCDDTSASVLQLFALVAESFVRARTGSKCLECSYLNPVQVLSIYDCHHLVEWGARPVP